MSVQARVNQMFGGSDAPVTMSISGTVANARVPDTASYIRITGASTPIVSSLAVPSWSRGRIVIFENTGATSIVFTNNASTTTANQMDLGTGDVTLATDSILALFCRPNGTWIRLFNTAN